MQMYVLNQVGKILCGLSSDADGLNSFNFYEATLTQNLTSPDTLEFTCVMTHPNSVHIAWGNQVVFKYRDEYHLFKITEIEEEHNDSHTVRCYCEGASTELINSVVIPSTNLAQTATQCLRILLTDTEWKVGHVDEFESKDLEFSSYGTVLAEIQNCAELYGAQVKYRIDYNATQGVKGKYIDFLEKRGEDKGIRFEYGVNSTDVTKKINGENIVTAVIPVGNNDLTIATIECEKDLYGFEKPKGQVWVGLDELERSEINNSPYHIFGTLSVETDDQYELAVKAWEYLQENKIPKIEYSFNPVIIQQEVNIGDTVRCIDREMNLQLEATVIEMQINLNDEAKNEITLSNYVEKESSINWELINAIQSELKNVEVEPEIIVSDTLPPVKEGKPIVWVDTSTANEDNLVVLKPFDGEQWQEVLTKEVVNQQMTNAINAIQIGGRNILWNTNFDSELMQQKGVGWWVKYDNVEVLNKNFMDKNVIHCINATDTNKDMLLQHIYSTNGITNRLENGKQYTLSFYIKGNGRVATYIYPQIGDTSQNRIIDGTVNGKATQDNSYTWAITDTWTRHTYTFTVNDTQGESRSFTGMLFRLREQSEVYIAMPQLEKGNKATDWSPAPEDIGLDISNIQGTLVTHEAWQEQTDRKWGSYVTSTQLTNAVDNIQIGGRNLASKDKITCTNGTCQISDYTYTFTKDGQYDGLVIDSSIFEIGETHTISFKFKKVSGTLESIGGHVGGFTSGFSTELLDGIKPSGNYGNGFALNDDTNTHEIVLIGKYYGDRVGGNNSLYIQPQRLGNSATSVTVEIWDIQVEKGNKATDWSPAPEDLEVTVSNLTNRVSTAESTLEQHSDLIATKVTQAEVENYVNGAIESLSGDGRNMVVYGNCNTDVPRLEENNYYQISSNLEASIIDNMLRFKPKAAGYCEYLLGDLTTLNGFENDTYTLAFNYNIPVGSTLTPENFAVLVHDGAKEYGTFLGDMNVVSTSTSWTRVSFTFTFVESWKRSIRIMLNATDANSYIYLDDIKVEKGATPTAFTKNPNEMTSAELAALKQRVTTAESTLEQHADKIESKVEQTTYETDMNGITTNLGTVTSTLTQHANMIETKVSKDGVISSINQSAESVTINATKINLKGAVTADSISSLNGLNVGNGQFVVDDSGNVTVGGTLNGASGTFTGKFTQDGTNADVTIDNGTILSEGTVTGVKTMVDEYGLSSFDSNFKSYFSPQSITWDYTPNNGSSEATSVLSLNEDGYMNLSGVGINISGTTTCDALSVTNNANISGTLTTQNLICTSHNTALWTGNNIMGENNYVYPTKTLTACTHGWMLIWSRYDGTQVYDDNYNIQFIPKTLLNYKASNLVSQVFSVYTAPCHKRMTIYNDGIQGNAANTLAQTNYYNYYDNSVLVLRYVFEY